MGSASTFLTYIDIWSVSTFSKTNEMRMAPKFSYTMKCSSFEHVPKIVETRVVLLYSFTLKFSGFKCSTKKFGPRFVSTFLEYVRRKLHGC